MTQTEKVRERIYTGLLKGLFQPGDPVPAEREMAEHLAVSRVTVRRAYEELAAAGVLRKFRGKGGTRIATDFQGHAGTSPLVAVIATLRDRFARDFIEAIQFQSLANDLLAVLAVTPEDPAEQEAMAVRMASRGVGNLIVWGFDLRLDFSLFERMRILGVNQVFFDRVKPGEFADYVALDNHHAMRQIVEAAGAAGCRHLIGIDAAGLDVDSNRERRAALDAAAQRCRLPVSWRELPWRGGGDAAGVLAGVAWTGAGVVTINDDLALRLRAAIPPGVPVFSVDGTSEAHEAGISSYRQPIDQLAALAIKALRKQQVAGGGWQAGVWRAKGGLQLC